MPCQGLSGCASLATVILDDNLISEWKTLPVLNELPLLENISFLGNPLCSLESNVNYRVQMISILISKTAPTTAAATAARIKLDRMVVSENEIATARNFIRKQTKKKKIAVIADTGNSNSSHSTSNDSGGGGGNQ